MEQYEELILEVAALAMRANRVTNHQFFVSFRGHVNGIDIHYLENGYKEDSKNRIDLLDLFIGLDDNVLDKLEKCKQHITALIEGNKKEPQEKVQ